MAGRFCLLSAERCSIHCDSRRHEYPPRSGPPKSNYPGFEGRAHHPILTGPVKDYLLIQSNPLEFSWEQFILPI